VWLVQVMFIYLNLMSHILDLDLDTHVGYVYLSQLNESHS